MRAGCLVPFVNLFWAPVYLIELAAAEGRLDRLRPTIVTWWCVWVFSTLVSVFSIATSFTRDAQGIADNTVTTIVAYLIALAALLLAHRVLLGFEQQARRPARQALGDRRRREPAAATSPHPSSRRQRSAVAVEAGQREPAA